MSGQEPAVIAAAGGVVLREANRRLLAAENVFTVRLRRRPGRSARRGSATTSTARCSTTTLRPRLRRLAAEREALYEEVADATVEVGDRDAGAVTAEVLELVAAREGT